MLVRRFPLTPFSFFSPFLSFGPVYMSSVECVLMIFRFCATSCPLPGARFGDADAAVLVAACTASDGDDLENICTLAFLQRNGALNIFRFSGERVFAGEGDEFSSFLLRSFLAYVDSLDGAYCLPRRCWRITPKMMDRRWLLCSLRVSFPKSLAHFAVTT